MKILIGSKNPGKIQGAKEAFVIAVIQHTNEIWNDKKIKLFNKEGRYKNEFI